MTVRILHGDCRDHLTALAAEGVRVHAVVTDPPYGIDFMGKKWDARENVAFQADTWRRVFDCMLPGAYLAAFGGTRQWHRMACAIEDAGFEIRDTLMWVYGSGFPKSLDVSKAIDKVRDDTAAILAVTSFVADAADARGISRAMIDQHMQTSDMGGWWLSRLKHRCQCPKWEQWLRLKLFLVLSDEMDSEVWRLNGRKGQPGEAWHDREVIGTAASSLGGTVAAGERNADFIAEHRGKAFNITAPATDAARQWSGFGTALKPAVEPIVLARRPLDGTVARNVLTHGCGGLNIDACRVGSGEDRTPGGNPSRADNSRGWGMGATNRVSGARFPANLIHDGSDEVEAAFAAFGDKSSPWIGNPKGVGAKGGKMFGGGNQGNVGKSEFGDAGSASRFFYSSKASKTDRSGSAHPTVKPTKLMEWLVQLVTPPGGTVLDPFAGTGSTGLAAQRLGMDAILIEQDAEYVADIKRKLAADLPARQDTVAVSAQMGLFGDTP